MRRSSSGQEVIAVVALCRFGVNMGFKQCMIDVVMQQRMEDRELHFSLPLYYFILLTNVNSV